MQSAEDWTAKNTPRKESNLSESRTGWLAMT